MKEVLLAVAAALSARTATAQTSPRAQVVIHDTSAELVLADFEIEDVLEIARQAGAQAAGGAEASITLPVGTSSRTVSAAQAAAVRGGLGRLRVSSSADLITGRARLTLEVGDSTGALTRVGVLEATSRLTSEIEVVLPDEMSGSRVASVQDALARVGFRRVRFAVANQLR